MLGSVVEGSWVRAEGSETLPEPGNSFRIYHADGHLMSQTERAGKGFSELPGCIRIDLTNDYTGVPTLGLSGTWQTQPQTWTLLYSESELYDRAVLDHLEARGLADPQLRVYDLVKTDFEQDGTDEIVLTANYYEPDPASEYAFERSLVLLRRVVGNEVETFQLLPRPEQTGPSVEWFGIFGLLDLNGDGDLEIVIEGEIDQVPGTWVFEVGADAPMEVLAVDCWVSY